MRNKTSSKILNRNSSASVKVKPDGTIVLPKSWIRGLSDRPVLATKINDVLVIIPQKLMPDYSIDQKNWKKIKPILRGARKQLFKEKYPQLYAVLQKKTN